MRHVLMGLVLLLFMGMTAIAPPASQAKPAPEVFGQLPNIYDAALSPDGTRLAYIGAIDGEYAIVVKDIATAQYKTGMRLANSAKPIDVVWVNDSYVLTRFWQSEKVKNVPMTFSYIYSLNADNGKGKILVKPRRTLRQNNSEIIDYLRDDPDHILMSFSERGNNIKPEIMKVNVRTGRYDSIRGHKENVDKWMTDLTGTPRIGQGQDPQTGRWTLRVRHTTSGMWKEADDFPGLDADTDIYGFTANPDELIIGAYRGQDTLGLYVYDLTQKSVTRTLFHNQNYDAGGLVLNHDGSDVIGVSYVADETQVEIFEAYSSTLDRMREKYKGATVSFVDQSKNGDLILFKLTSPSDPGGILLLDSKTDTLSVVGAMYEGLSADNLGKVVSVPYRARDDERIPAYITLPPSVTQTSQIKNLPFIILPHGGPYARESKRFDYFAQFFASRGYGVLQMNFRGSTGFGKKFEEAGRNNWDVMHDDVEDGTRFLIEAGYADPDRLCIAGWSYGGYAALMGALKTPELYSCAISMAGVTDLKDLIKDMKKYQGGRLAAKDFRKGFENASAMNASSPVKLADSLSVPLFLAHGELDQRVHFDQFKRMKKALRKSDADVTYMEFEDEDHFLSNEANRKKFFIGLDAFLSEVNGESEFAQ